MKDVNRFESAVDVKSVVLYCNMKMGVIAPGE